MINLVSMLSDEYYWENAKNRFMVKKIGLNTAEQLLDIRDNVSDIVNRIKECSYNWSTPSKLELTKVGSTKKRVVYIYSVQDRVVQRVLYEILSEYFKDRLAASCFSYKRGVTTLTAVSYLMNCGNINQMYGCKVDIKSYFNSVDKQKILNVIDELFVDEVCIHKLLKDLYSNEVVKYKDKVISEDMSLIPGSAVASFFANYLLRELDTMFEQKGIPYARYCDDIIFFDTTEQGMMDGLRIIEDFLRGLGLGLNEKKLIFFNPGDRIEFLGLHIENGIIDMAESSKTKIKKLIKHKIKRARRKVERVGQDIFENKAVSVIKYINYMVYKCLMVDANKYGWAFYMFRYINTYKSLQELDYYYKDRLRYLKTGKNNSANIKKFTEEEMRSYGWVSFCEMYKTFRINYEAYLEKCSLM